MRWITRVMFAAGLAIAAASCHQNDTVFTVDTTLDTVDSNPGDGFCNDANGDCSFRAAVMEANALPGVEEIRLVDGAVYELTIPGGGEDAAATGDLDIRSGMVIVGDAELTTVGEDFLLHLYGPGGIELDGLDLSSSPRGIRIDGADTTAFITNSDVEEVQRWIYMTDGAVVIEGASHDSQFFGLPVIEARNGFVSLTNLSVSEPGLFVQTVDANVVVTHSTFAFGSYESFQRVEGGVGEISLGSSYLDGGCSFGPAYGFVSRGYNVSSWECLELDQPTDVQFAGWALRSSELRRVEGPVRTFSILADGPLVDAAATSQCAGGVDARDVERPFGVACDVGAVEAQPSPDCDARGPGLDFRLCDFSYQSLVGQDFRDGDFFEALLRSADASNAQLDGADFSGADLTSANLSGASATGVTIDGGSNIIAVGTDFSGALLRNVDFGDITDASFANATLERVGTSFTAFREVDLSGATMREMDFYYADGMSLRDATLIDSRVINAPGADFSGLVAIGGEIGGDLGGINIDGADLSQTEFYSYNPAVPVVGTPAALPDGVAIIRGLVVGPRSSVRNADLSDLDLLEVDMTRVDATNADLSGSRLSLSVKRAGLEGADLSGADMSGTDAYGSGMSGAQLVGVDASDAIFEWARLGGTTIVGVDFTGANLRSAWFRDALMLWNTFDNTTCPTGVISNDNGGNCDGQWGFGEPQPPGAPVPEEFQGREAEFATFGES